MARKGYNKDGRNTRTRTTLTASTPPSFTPRGVCERGKRISSSVSSSNSLIASCKASDALFNAAGSRVLANLYSIAEAVGIAFDEDEPSSTLSPTLERLLVVEAAILPLSCGGGLELDCNDDAMLNIDVVPSGVIGRKLELLVLSATEFTRAAAIDDSVGVMDAVLLLVLAELPLLFPDPILLIYE